MDLERVTCPVNAHHRRAGRRLADLSVTLPRGTVQDFVWTWYSECLIQDHVLQLFRENKFTGFDVKPVVARFKSPRGGNPPRLWELVLTGWGGLAKPESGITRVEFCGACHFVHYSGIKDASYLVDDKQFDGSDIFMIWPMPAHVFITERVADCIRDCRLTGVVLKPSCDIKQNPAVIDGYGPGRLSDWMPEARARVLGEMSGIEEI
jgi:hypothetical protein